MRVSLGLSGSQKKRKEAISKQVVDILQGFVDIKLLVNKPTSVHEKDLKGYYKVTALSFAFLSLVLLIYGLQCGAVCIF